MKYDTMTPDQMLAYLKLMDELEKKLIRDRERILEEIREMQERKEILSWDEIASAVAYPKAMSDRERVGGGNPDEYKLLHQAERINRIYISQMEELFAELENIEKQITKRKYVSRCISRLDEEEQEFIRKFICSDLTYEKGAELFHVSRSSLYRLQRKTLKDITQLYNGDDES